MYRLPILWIFQNVGNSLTFISIIYSRINPAGPKVYQGEYAIGDASNKGIHKVHNPGGKGDHEAIKDHENRVKGMGPQVVELSPHFRHCYKDLYI